MLLSPASWTARFKASENVVLMRFFGGLANTM